MVLTGHTLAPWKSTESLKQYKPTPIVTTNTIFKDYDPVTGNKVINDKYMIIHEIGRGVHGKVKLAQSLETDEYVAIKIVDKRTRKRQLSHAFLRPTQQTSLSIDKENEQKIRREIAILKKCAHPHVVQLKEIMDDPESNKIYMVLEYMDGGEIEWRDENDQPVLEINEVRNIFRDVICGLDYLHYQGVIHRDIKPANLLYSKDHVVKISDFGVSYFNKILAGKDDSTSSIFEQQRSDQVDRELAETAGTPAFFAPELCWAGENRQDYRHKITRAIDVWALGVTLYCFVYGECPFTAATEYELFEIIPTQPLTFPKHATTTHGNNDDDDDADLKDLLQRLLEKDPQQRITLDQVKVHPWVIKDLDRPEIWWEEADPRRYKPVHITEEDVTQAYTMMDRLKRSLHKLSSSFTNITKNITRRRSKSSCQTTATSPNQLVHFKTASTAPASSSALFTPTFSPTTLQPQPTKSSLPSNNFHDLNRTPSSFTSLSNGSKTSSIDMTCTSSLNHNNNNNNNNNNNAFIHPTNEFIHPTQPHPLEKNSHHTQFHPIQSDPSLHELSSTSLSIPPSLKESHKNNNNNNSHDELFSGDDEEEDEDAHSQFSSHSSRPDYQRNNSTTSSMSGLVVSFGKKNRGASALTPSFGFTKHHD